MKKLILGTAMIVALSAPLLAADLFKIKKEDYGDKWPFTVEEGHIGCLKGLAPFFQAPDGTKYALTGLGQSLRLKNINPIWRDDPAPLGVKINLGDIIQLGLAYCKK